MGSMRALWVGCVRFGPFRPPVQQPGCADSSAGALLLRELRDRERDRDRERTYTPKARAPGEAEPYPFEEGAQVCGVGPSWRRHPRFGAAIMAAHADVSHPPSGVRATDRCADGRGSVTAAGPLGWSRVRARSLAPARPHRATRTHPRNHNQARARTHITQARTDSHLHRQHTQARTRTQRTRARACMAAHARALAGTSRSTTRRRSRSQRGSTFPSRCAVGKPAPRLSGGAAL